MNGTMNSQKSNLLEMIKTKGYCLGCGLCQALVEENQIVMRINASGFLRPTVIKKISSEAENNISKLCPGINIHHQTHSISPHVYWGPVLKSRTAFATEPEVRYQGSSGGVISALAIFLIESKKVDYIVQTAVSNIEPLVNITQKSRNKSDILYAAGSRYAPSSPLSNIKEFFETEETFAFIGKPCDVAALRMFLNEYPQYKKQVKYLISFMCAGVPSIKGTHDVIKKMGADINKVVKFKYRGDGWPGYAKALDSDGESYTMDYNSSWGEILGRQIQFRCKICPDGTGEFADIVCADAWYGKDGYPDFKEQEGRSLLLSRTSVGESLITDAFENNYINMQNLDVTDISKMQPYQVSRKQVVLGRVISAGIANKYIVKYRHMGLLRASITVNPLTWLRQAWGTFKRTNREEQ